MITHPDRQFFMKAAIKRLFKRTLPLLEKMRPYFDSEPDLIKHALKLSLEQKVKIMP